MFVISIILLVHVCSQGLAVNCTQGEVGDTHICQSHCESTLLKIHHTSRSTYRFNQYSLMFHTLFIEVKFCSYNPSSNFNFYLWNGALLFQQPLHKHHARLLQLCKVANTLHKLPWPCHNLTMLQQGYYNLVISIWIYTVVTQLKLQ